MLGVVNLDKPVGPTSHDMVALMRRLTGIRRVGHAGTLDPLASGVLPILLGHATRFSDELSGGSKRYDATVRLGATSLTDDGEGPIAPTGVPPPSRDELERAIGALCGTYAQRPPAFSARKQGGRTAYRAARAGEPLDIAPRTITVHSVVLRDLTTAGDCLDATLEVHCHAGTYIRAIARDLGERLGCGAYLSSLRRTEAAGLRVDAAHAPRELEELAGRGELSAAIQPVADLLRLPVVELPVDAGARFRNGASVPAHGDAAGRTAVLAGGTLLGIGVVADGVLRPVKVIPETPA